MHMPTLDPREDEEEPDVKTPPVPPDQKPDVVPQREPPNPAQSPPLIVLRSPACVDYALRIHFMFFLNAAAA
jgi:hypothetical protein